MKRLNRIQAESNTAAADKAEACVCVRRRVPYTTLILTVLHGSMISLGALVNKTGIELVQQYSLAYLKRGKKGQQNANTQSTISVPFSDYF